MEQDIGQDKDDEQSSTTPEKETQNVSQHSVESE